MCGIIGVTGVDDALPSFSRDSVARVPGYDSPAWRSSRTPACGVRALPRGRTRCATCSSAAATRHPWPASASAHPLATHGQPDTGNAHPHFDCTGRLALVHNGIIENHAELARDLVRVATC